MIELCSVLFVFKALNVFLHTKAPELDHLYSIVAVNTCCFY